MKNSIFYFISGIVLGVLITISFEFSNKNDISLDSKISDIDQVLTNLNDTTNNLSVLLENYTQILPHISSTSSTNNYSKDAESQTSNSYPSESTKAKSSTTIATHINKNTPIKTTITPTPEQSEQYNSIETRLYEAANNPNVTLSKLIKESGDLTNEQRHNLTQKAMEMIKNGELDINQFSVNPDT